MGGCINLADGRWSSGRPIITDNIIITVSCRGDRMIAMAMAKGGSDTAWPDNEMISI